MKESRDWALFFVVGLVVTVALLLLWGIVEHQAFVNLCEREVTQRLGQVLKAENSSCIGVTSQGQLFFVKVD